MNSNRRRWTHAIAAAALALALGLGFSGVARAQDDPGEAGASEGRPLDGYMGAGILAGLAVFIIGKSARR